MIVVFLRVRPCLLVLASRLQIARELDERALLAWSRLRGLATKITVPRESPSVKLLLQAHVPPRMALSFDSLMMKLHVVPESHLNIVKVCWLLASLHPPTHREPRCTDAERKHVVDGLT